MTASASIKTPSMSVPLLQTQQAINKGQYLKKLFTRVSLAEVFITNVLVYLQYSNSSL